MQAENAATIINLLQASYPAEAYKLNNIDDNPKGDKFSIMLLEIFGAVPDSIMSQAVKIAIRSYQKLPSIGDIAKCVDQCRPMPKYPELPQPRKKIDMTIINEAFRLACDHKIQAPISDKLREFAKKHFPDIDDKLIRQNYCELSYNMRSGMRIGEYDVCMIMSPDGYIYTQVCAPKFFYRRTNGVPDNFTKVFGEGEKL